MDVAVSENQTFFFFFIWLNTSVITLTLAMLWANSADIKLMIFFLENGDNLHENVKSCFLGKIRKKISKYCLLKIFTQHAKC